MSRSSASTPTSRWVAQLLRTSSVNDRAFGFAVGTGHYELGWPGGHLFS